MASTKVRIDGTETVSKASREAAGGIENLKNKVKDVTKPFNDLNQTAKMLFTGGGIVLGAREIAKTLADCEAAFVKLNPQMAQARGSAKQFGEAWTALKASAGGIVSMVLSPFRAILIDIIDGITQFKAKAEELARMEAATADFRNKVLLSDAEYSKKKIEELKKDLDDAKVDLKRFSDTLGGQEKILSALKAGGSSESRITGMETRTDETRKLQAEANDKVRSLTEEIERLEQVIKNSATVDSKMWESFLDSLMTRELANREDEMAKGQQQLRDSIEYWQEKNRKSLTDIFSDLNKNIGQAISNFESKLSEETGTAPTADMDAGMESGIAALLQFASSIRSINALMNPMQIALDGFAKILAPLVDQVLSPIIGALYVLGMTMAQIIVPVFNILGPVVTALAESFVWLYNNAILPVGNFFIDILTVLGNIFVVFANAVSDVIKFVTLGLVNLGHMSETPIGSNHLQAISLESLTTMGANYLSGEGGGGYGSSTTVQQVPDIYVYQTFEGPVIGDGAMAKVGEFTVEAIRAYLGTGARVEFLEN